MDENDIVTQIIAGTAPGEAPADALHLCMAALLAKLSMGQLPELSQPAVETIPTAQASEYGSMVAWHMALIGVILCPIFTIVKPKEYVEAMTTVRLSYKGIASDLQLQNDYLTRVRPQIRLGRLDSLEQAIEGRLWEELDPRLEGLRY
jgi:hypothetical protein